MRTRFTEARLAEPDIRHANGILRSCVHCGFCNATCPTYVLTGDERDGPRGRIYMIKEMLEDGGPAAADTRSHIDRCLSCLGCMTTCPSGVDYMHLVDLARRHIETTGTRPLGERLLRGLLARVLPYPSRFRRAVRLARLARPLASIMPGRLGAMMALAPAAAEKADSATPGVHPARGIRRMRVALLAGCVQQTLAPAINAATISLLTRHGCEVIVAGAAGCCGAISHHMGRAAEAHDQIRANVAAWQREIDGDGLDAIVINASGCGTMVKDYGHILRDDPEWAERAGRVAALARDVSEVVSGLDLMHPARGPGLVVAYQSPCSLRHGQGVDAAPRMLLTACGFDVRAPAEPHMCCGSAGTYNIMQPDLAGRLRDRKAASLDALGADVVASGNIGCMTQLAGAIGVPVVHTVELLDWATGGRRPAALAAEKTIT